MQKLVYQQTAQMHGEKNLESPTIKTGASFPGVSWSCGLSSAQTWAWRRRHGFNFSSEHDDATMSRKFWTCMALPLESFTAPASILPLKQRRSP